MHADAGAGVAAVGQGEQAQVGRGPVQGAQHVVAGADQVVHRAGCTSETQIGSPSGRITAWRLPPKSWVFPAYQASMVFP
jgi:hypothetical protein